MKFPISVIIYLIIRALFLCYFLIAFCFSGIQYFLYQRAFHFIFSSASIHYFFLFSIYKLCKELKCVSLNIGLCFGYQMILL